MHRACQATVQKYQWFVTTRQASLPPSEFTPAFISGNLTLEIVHTHTPIESVYLSALDDKLYTCSHSHLTLCPLRQLTVVEEYLERERERGGLGGVGGEINQMCLTL